MNMKTRATVIFCLSFLTISTACNKETITIEEIVCEDACRAFNNDGECDDGGDGSDTDICRIGTDCSDCGERIVKTEERVKR
jgi:hypothetical protein